MRFPRFQFRLRTLMIVVTLLAMVAGTMRLMGPPWLDTPSRWDSGFVAGWLILAAAEFYIAWIVLRFACRR
jgi:hypothetical protein